MYGVLHHARPYGVANYFVSLLLLSLGNCCQRASKGKSVMNAPSVRRFKAVANLRSVISRNRVAGIGGTYAICSAHPWVLEAAAQQAHEDNSILHVESTSSQVNHEGGYTGQTPAQFAQSMRLLTRRIGLGPERLLLG